MREYFDSTIYMQRQYYRRHWPLGEYVPFRQKRDLATASGFAPRSNFVSPRENQLIQYKGPFYNTQLTIHDLF